MKMLFIHDNKFWLKESTFYSYGHFSYELLWKRYLKSFDEIVVGGRVIDTEKVQDQDLSRFAISSGKHVRIIALPDLLTVKGLFRYKEAKNLIETEITHVDFLVARLPSNLGYIACGLAEKKGIPYAVEVVGCCWDSYWNHGSLTGKLIAPIQYILERHYVKKASNVLYVSRHFLQRRYPNSNFNMGCPDSNIQISEQDIIDKRIHKISNMSREKTIRIGLIASLNVGYKGHDTAILALEHLVKKYQNSKLCFLGDGKKDKWEKLAREHNVLDYIEFCGSLPGGAPVLHWLDDIDIFIMPSLQETLGRALIEAMSRGCPAIGGAGTAVPEQLPDDCIHERKNHKQLAEMIIYMIEHPEYMKLCAEENFVRAKKYSEKILEERRDYFWRTAIGNVSK